MSENQPETEQQSSNDGDQELTEDDYGRGETNDPEGAEREEPAGEDYAGSGF